MIGSRFSALVRSADILPDHCAQGLFVQYQPTHQMQRATMAE